MRRRLLSILAALLISGAVLVGGSTPAQAACPTSGSTPLSATWGAQNVTVRTYWVRCDNGTPGYGLDDYIRLQRWRYDDTSDISRTIDDPGDAGCCPVTVWSPKAGGPAVNSVSGYSAWLDNAEIVLNNASCPIACTVQIWGRADRIAVPDTDFYNFVHIG